MTKNTSTPTKPPGSARESVKGDDGEHGDGTQAVDVAAVT